MQGVVKVTFGLVGVVVAIAVLGPLAKEVLDLVFKLLVK